MNIAIIGSGGREHALCFKLSESQNVKKIFCIPGNAGTSMVGAVAKDVSGVVSTTAEVVSGVADTVGNEVKEQSDELKVEAPDFPTGKLKEEG